MATTTNYGWGTPDDTDLVKDGALAIRDLGQDIDTTTKALNPETTTGDIAYRSATANTNTRLAIGTAGQVLTVNSGATAPEWATPAAAGGWTLLATKTLSGTATNTISTISQSYNTLYLAIVGMAQTSNGIVEIKPNGTTSLYAWGMIDGANTTATVANSQSSSAIPFAGYNVSATQNINGAFLIYNYTSSNPKMFQSYGRGQDSSSGLTTNITNGIDRNTAAITSIDIISSTSATAGTAYLYGI
jgi:hypothetical protein